MRRGAHQIFALTSVVLLLGCRGSSTTILSPGWPEDQVALVLSSNDDQVLVFGEGFSTELPFEIRDDEPLEIHAFVYPRDRFDPAACRPSRGGEGRRVPAPLSTWSATVSRPEDRITLVLEEGVTPPLDLRCACRRLQFDRTFTLPPNHMAFALLPDGPETALLLALRVELDGSEERPREIVTFRISRDRDPEALPLVVSEEGYPRGAVRTMDGAIWIGGSGMLVRGEVGGGFSTKLSGSRCRG